MIYFMQAVDGGPIKIGFSDNVPTRRDQLESLYKLPLAVLATLEGDRSAERAIHKKFSHLRLGRTEQFRPAPDLMAFIGRPLLVSPNPDCVEAMPYENKAMVLGVRGSVEWKEWLDELALHCRLNKVDIVDLALVDFARKSGFRDPPLR